MAEAVRKDPLEPPGVPVRPLILTVVCGFVLMLVLLGLLLLFFNWRVKGSAAITERPFPAPRLETSIAPRAVAVENHGPAIPEPTRELDPRTKPAPLTSGHMSLEQAMAVIAAKGAQAYDPVSGPLAATQRDATMGEAGR